MLNILLDSVLAVMALFLVIASLVLCIASGLAGMWYHEGRRERYVIALMVCLPPISGFGYLVSVLWDSAASWDNNSILAWFKKDVGSK